MIGLHRQLEGIQNFKNFRELALKRNLKFLKTIQFVKFFKQKLKFFKILSEENWLKHLRTFMKIGLRITNRHYYSTMTKENLNRKQNNENTPSKSPLNDFTLN